MDHDHRLSPHFVWLFALIAVLGGLGLSFLTARHGWRLSAAVFFGFVGAMAFLAGYLTRASALQVIGPFVVASAALGTIYYVIVKSVLTAAGATVGAAGRVDGVAGVMGVVVAVVIVVDALAASVGGALFGIRLRAVKAPGQLLRRAA